MPKLYHISKLIISDRSGTEHYLLSVVHPADRTADLKPGSDLEYISTHGLKLLFNRHKVHGGASDKVSIFSLGITNKTFKGKGTFKLSITCFVSGEPEENDTIEIVRVGATDNPDEMKLYARFLGDQLLA